MGHRLSLKVCLLRVSLALLTFANLRSWREEPLMIPRVVRASEQRGLSPISSNDYRELQTPFQQYEN